jgi:hypothetical protein
MTRRARIIQPMNTKLGTFDNFVHTTNSAKFGYDQMREVVWAVGWNEPLWRVSTFSLSFFFSPYYYQQIWSQFRCWHVRRRVSVRICATTLRNLPQPNLRRSFTPKNPIFPKTWWFATRVLKRTCRPNRLTEARWKKLKWRHAMNVTGFRGWNYWTSHRKEMFPQKPHF